MQPSDTFRKRDIGHAVATVVAVHCRCVGSGRTAEWWPSCSPPAPAAACRRDAQARCGARPARARQAHGAAPCRRRRAGEPASDRSSWSPAAPITTALARRGHGRRQPAWADGQMTSLPPASPPPPTSAPARSSSGSATSRSSRRRRGGRSPTRPPTCRSPSPHLRRRPRGQPGAPRADVWPLALLPDADGTTRAPAR